MIYVDADACPVRDEVVRVAERHGVRGDLRHQRRPAAEPRIRWSRIVVVEQGADAADKWIAERIGPGDVCVTADVPLAARCVERGRAGARRRTARPSPRPTSATRLAMRDLMADLRAADPFRQGGGRPFARRRPVALPRGARARAARGGAGPSRVTQY